MLALKSHAVSVNCVAFSPDGKRLATSVGQLVKVWDATIGQETFTLNGHTNTVVNCVAFSPDGKRLASSSAYGDQTVKVWDAMPRRVRWHLR